MTVSIILQHYVLEQRFDCSSSSCKRCEVFKSEKLHTAQRVESATKRIYFGIINRNMTIGETKNGFDVLPASVYYIIGGIMSIAAAIASLQVILKHMRSKRQIVNSSTGSCISATGKTNGQMREFSEAGEMTLRNVVEISSRANSECDDKEILQESLYSDPYEYGEPIDLLQSRCSLVTRQAAAISQRNMNRNMSDLYTKINPLTKTNFSKKFELNSFSGQTSLESNGLSFRKVKYTEIGEISEAMYLTPTDLSRCRSSSVSHKMAEYPENAAAGLDGTTKDIEINVKCVYLTPSDIISNNSSSDSMEESYKEMEDLINLGNEGSYTEIRDFRNMDNEETYKEIPDFMNQGNEGPYTEIHDFRSPDNAETYKEIPDFMNQNNEEPYTDIQDFTNQDNEERYTEIHDFINQGNEEPHTEIHDVMKPDNDESYTEIHDLMLLNTVEGTYAEIQDYV